MGPGGESGASLEAKGKAELDALCEAIAVAEEAQCGATGLLKQARRKRDAIKKAWRRKEKREAAEAELSRLYSEPLRWAEGEKDEDEDEAEEVHGQ